MIRPAVLLIALLACSCGGDDAVGDRAREFNARQERLQRQRAATVGTRVVKAVPAGIGDAPREIGGRLVHPGVPGESGANPNAGERTPSAATAGAIQVRSSGGDRDTRGDHVRIRTGSLTRQARAADDRRRIAEAEARRKAALEEQGARLGKQSEGRRAALTRRDAAAAKAFRPGRHDPFTSKGVGATAKHPAAPARRNPTATPTPAR